MDPRAPKIRGKQKTLLGDSSGIRLKSVYAAAVTLTVGQSPVEGEILVRYE